MALVKSAGIRGIDPVPVEVTATLRKGLPRFDIVGLRGDRAVSETRVRVKSALEAAGWWPNGNLQVQVEPQCDPDPAFDLPIALAVAQAAGFLPDDGGFAFGELALDGRVRGARGAIVRAQGVEQFEVVPDVGYVSQDNAFEVARVRSGVTLLDHLAEAAPAEVRWRTEHVHSRTPAPQLDLGECNLLPETLRALEVALTLQRPFLLVGPPGAGKTMIARRIPGVLCSLSEAEGREVLAIASVAGLLLLRDDAPMVAARPFRAPHHSCSEVALVGGGPMRRPGELSLAHRGVLFLDELPEFRRLSTQAVGSVLDQGAVTLGFGIGETATLPAAPAFVVASTNPCPCGYYGHFAQCCKCHPTAVQAYTDRLRWAARAIHARMAVPTPTLRGPGVNERRASVSMSSEEMRGRVARAQNLLDDVDDVRAPGRSELTRQVARCCAAVDGSREVQAEHWREAEGYTALLVG